MRLPLNDDPLQHAPANLFLSPGVHAWDRERTNE